MVDVGRAGLVYDSGKTPEGKRKQVLRSFRGDADQAESWRRKLLEEVRDGTHVAPHERTVEQWLTEWLDKAIRGKTAKATETRYEGIVAQGIVPNLGAIRLQDLKSLDVSTYYGSLKLAQATVQLHHTVLSTALKAAVTEGLVVRNVAALATGRPKGRRSQADVLDHVWTADEASTFLAAAKQAGPQLAALFALALDSGMRRGEIGALQWAILTGQKGQSVCSGRCCHAVVRPSMVCRRRRPGSGRSISRRRRWDY